MRHRGQNETSQTEGSTSSGTSVTLADLMTAARNPAQDSAQDSAQSPAAPLPGKHRAPVAPVIPEQKLPTHDTAAKAPADRTAEDARRAALQAAVAAAASRDSAADAAPEIPDTAQWKSSHLPRILSGSLLALAVAGTTALGIRYAGSRTSDDFISLAIGVGVVVVLWAVMIASTPQAVILNGSVLTIRNTSGVETFDLSDGLQSVDVVGDPRTSHWAVLLHRPNATTVVLRRNDVNAAEFDPIVRHYRTAATRRFSERQARFSS